jgi:hypothetical protein
MPSETEATEERHPRSRQVLQISVTLLEPAKVRDVPVAGPGSDDGPDARIVAVSPASVVTRSYAGDSLQLLAVP